MPPRVLVSHPGRQHAHQLVLALQQGGYLARFITSIWYKPGRYPYKLVSLFPPRLKEAVEKELKKRYFEDVEESFVEQFPLFELLREGFDRLSRGYRRELGIFLVNRIHDWQASRRIGKIRPDVLVGYETSCLRSFGRAGKDRIITILDLVSAPYWFQRRIWSLSQSDPYEGSNELHTRIGKVKRAELDIADYIFVPADYVKRILIEAGIPGGKIIKLPYGVSTSLFKAKVTYRRSGTFKILYVGSMMRGKGIQYMLQAFKELHLTNAELVLIGGIGDGADVLREYEGFYKYIPFLHHADLVKYYQDADILVFPSLLEGFAQVVIEAMSCGTPVIVTENSGSSDAVRDGIDGFIVPIMDVEGLKNRTLYFYENRSMVEEMGKNAASSAQAYTWENYRKRAREIIEEIWSQPILGVRC